jgi:MoaA/NifB/PqqE/SkfB family radical SAM enzyme/predicted O-methyltransferase YrrM/tetratricopeptide (TPR) repeat protein
MDKYRTTKGFEQFVPENFVVETVLGCNLKCPECAVGGGIVTRKRGAMTFEQFKIIADKIRPFCQYLYLHCWGEPLLNKDIFEIIRYASAFTKTDIHTNGNSLTEETAEQLITSGVTDVSVSIDGMSQEIYQQYRVGGSLDKALESVRMLNYFNLKYGKKVNLSSQFVVFKHNQHQMELFGQFCRSLGLNPCFKSPYLRHDSRLEDPDDPKYIRSKLPDTATLRQAMCECDNPRKAFTILLDGTCVACCYDHSGITNYGNIYREDVLEIWNSPAYRKDRLDIITGNAPEYCVEECLKWTLCSPASNNNVEGRSDTHKDKLRCAGEANFGSKSFDHGRLVEVLRLRIKSMPQIEPVGNSEAEKAWIDYRIKLRKAILEKDISNFMNWDVIKSIIFMGPSPKEFEFLKNIPSWGKFGKALGESLVGGPQPFPDYPLSSGNTIHQAYNLAQLIEIGNCPVADLPQIVEFGGGFGTMCKLVHQLGFKGRYIIFDLPEFSAMQEYYLNAVGLQTGIKIDQITDSKQCVVLLSDIKQVEQQLKIPAERSAFMAVWSISETPTDFRDRIFNLVSNADYHLIAYQDYFRDVDNTDYFAKLSSKKPQIRWYNYPIEHFAKHNYLIGTKVSDIAETEAEKGMGNMLIKTVAEKPEDESADAAIQNLFKEGIGRMKSGNFAEALNLFGKALLFHRATPNLHFAMATAYARLGKLDSAKKECEMELILQPGHSGIKELLKRIEEAINECERGKAAQKEDTHLKDEVSCSNKAIRTPDDSYSIPKVARTESQILHVVGAERYQRRVLEAWTHIETDAPIRKRIQWMQEHMENGRPFWNIHVALAFLAERIKPKTYLEIGVRTGCSLVQVLNNATPELVVGLDIWDGMYADMPNTVDYTQSQIARFQSSKCMAVPVKLIQGNSHKALKQFIAAGMKFDLITIDGDHSEAGAEEDLVDCEKLLAEQGAIVFDDIIHPSLSFLHDVTRRFAEKFPYFTVLTNTVQDNGCVIFLKNIDSEQLLQPSAEQMAKSYVTNSPGTGITIRPCTCTFNSLNSNETGELIASINESSVDSQLAVAVFEKLLKRPQYLKIETTNICNANCSFCAYQYMTRPKQVMPRSIFEKTIDDYVAIGGGALTLSPEVGDCLVDSHFLERLRYCRKYDQITNIGLHTNLIGMTRWTDEQVIEIFELIDNLNVSLGPNRNVYKDMFGVDKFDTVLAGLERLNLLKSKTEHAPKFNINGRACAGEFAVDSRLDQLGPALMGLPIRWSTTYFDWGGQLGDLPRNTKVNRADETGAKRVPCMKPLISSVVFADGQVGFCGCADFDAKLAIGDLNMQDLRAILSGQKRQEYIISFFKNSLNEYCHKCTFYEPLNIKFISQWVDFTNPYAPEPVRKSIERLRPITTATVTDAASTYDGNAAEPQAPKFSFVMIVLNGMPFIEYSLKSIYDFAHEIVIVEGAVEKCMFAANPDGSSTDGTIEFIRAFPDPRKKIRFIQGRWPEKCEMQNEALRYVTGDYVWLIDSDEVYKTEDLEKVETLVKNDPSITQLNFNGDNFWKGLDYLFVSPKFFETGAHWRRVFKFVKGASFTTHRPPTMVWPGSKLTTEQIHLVDGHQTRKMGIIPCHYSYVLDKQVWQKIDLYNRYGWGENWGIDLNEWYKECFLKWTPQNREQIEARYGVWTGDKNSYTQLFTGTHPEVMKDFKNRFGQKEILSEKRVSTEVQDNKSKRLKVAGDYVKSGTTVDTESFFGTSIKELFGKIRPRKIIETGTYLGTGTTTIIAKSLESLGIKDAIFFTIEVNPGNYASACRHFASNNMKVNALNGLSVPRSMLPAPRQIEQETITNIGSEDIFVDHNEERRVELYYNETDFPNVPDNLLYDCLKAFDFKPDFVLLDSGGHMGHIEFNYLIEHLQGTCYIAIDDIYHVKHYKSFKRIQNDPRFELITASKEKFGFCIAKLLPLGYKVAEETHSALGSVLIKESSRVFNENRRKYALSKE